MKRKKISPIAFVFKDTCGEEAIQAEHGYGGILFVNHLGISRKDFEGLAKWYGYEIKRVKDGGE